jgi:hypothetical protein
MQQLTIDEDALLEEAIKLAAAEKEEMEALAAKKETSKLLVGEHGEECGHGYVKTEDHFNIKDFADTFISGSCLSALQLLFSSAYTPLLQPQKNILKYGETPLS